MIRTQLENYIVENAGVTRDKLADPGLKMADLGLDSLGIVEMLFEVEDKYGFRIEEVMRYGGMTFDEVVADIEHQVRAHGIDLAAHVQGGGVTPPEALAQ